MDFDSPDSDSEALDQIRNQGGSQARLGADTGSRSAETSTRGGRSGAGMASSSGARPEIVRLEDEPRARPSRPDYSSEVKEWKRGASSVDERKAILNKLLSRQKSMNTGRGGGGTRVGLDLSDDDSSDENKPQKSNFASREKLRNYLLEMRTGMPAKDVDTALSPHGRQQHVQHYDMELMKRMDAEAFADISSIMSRQCANILSCPDMLTVKRVCAHAQTDLAIYGISQLQLWTTGTDDKDTLESSGVDSTAAGSVVLRLPHVTKALQIAEDEGKISRGGGSGGLADVGIKIATVRPDDFSWDELERAMRLVGGESGSVSHSASKKWYAIHIVSPSPKLYLSLGLPGSGSADLPRQVLLMSESVVSTNTVAVSNRMAHSSPYKVKSLFMSVAQALRPYTSCHSALPGRATGLYRRSLAQLERSAALAELKEAKGDGRRQMPSE